MDFIEKIESILSNSGLISPVFDIHIDEKNNIVGYICDELFEQKNDAESQQLIWESLKKHFGQAELIKISVLFHETPRERAERLKEVTEKLTSKPKNIELSKIWQHTKFGLKYWLFVDVKKFDAVYKSFFLIINAKEKFKKGVTFVYPQDVLDFMELSDDGEICEELYFSAFNNAESEIKLDLMKKYDELTKKGLWGNQNNFNYVFKDFSLVKVNKVRLKFDDEEIAILEGFLKNLEDFPVKKEIEKAIEISKMLNNLSSPLIAEAA